MHAASRATSERRLLPPSCQLPVLPHLDVGVGGRVDDQEAQVRELDERGPVGDDDDRGSGAAASSRGATRGGGGSDGGRDSGRDGGRRRSCSGDGGGSCHG